MSSTKTITAATSAVAPAVHASLPFSIRDYPRLDRKQAGHLRHYHNLVSQPDGDWHYFGTADAHHEFDDAARYQLATMTYAMGAAHYHRLPALRGPIKALMDRTIHKMLRREVWSYWFVTSHSGNIFDPDLKELRAPWADPVVKENIMYSGHLLLMTSLYAMLFDDDKFEREGGLTFNWNPLFWGFGPEKFVYDNQKLQDVILKQMEDNNWIGVCCEPNAIFVVCNQFPLVAMRYNDVRHGTDKVQQEILPKYRAALQKHGMLGDDGLYACFYALKQKKSVAARHGAHTAWANAFMNAWHPQFVRSSYEKQTLGFLTNHDGVTALQPTKVAISFRKLVMEDGLDPEDRATLDRARAESVNFKTKSPFETLNWLSFTMMLSELGKQKELGDLLDHADAHLNPTWVDGGFYYPRNGELVDDEWNLVAVEPHSGNSGIGYARLNVEDGQRKMWEQPWTRESVARAPWLDGVGFGDDVDFFRATWDEQRSAMIVTLRRWRGDANTLTLLVKNLPPATYATYVNGGLVGTQVLRDGGDVAVKQEVGQDEVDIVVCRV